MIKTMALASATMLAAAAAWGESPAADTAAQTTPVAAEVDLEAAAKIFQRSCRACHGNKAQGASSYPQLNDKDPEDIAAKLVRYRSGEKIGPNSILMIQHAKKLSDTDIASLAVYVTTAFD